jgi:hypothetical protein
VSDDPREPAEAARLARLVDGLLAGEPLPPAMEAEQRALVETAALIRAARPLPDARKDQLIDDALRGRRRGRPAAWIAATALAAAAALFLALRPPARGLPEELASRPADRLVGRIERPEDGRARADLIYADRLAGYRRLILDGGRR